MDAGSLRGRACCTLVGWCVKWAWGTNGFGSVHGRATAWAWPIRGSWGRSRDEGREKMGRIPGTSSTSALGRSAPGACSTSVPWAIVAENASGPRSRSAGGSEVGAETPEVWGMIPKMSVSRGSRAGGLDTLCSGVCEVSVAPVRANGSSWISGRRWRSGIGGGRVSNGAVVVEMGSMTCRLARWSRELAAKATNGRVGQTDTPCGARATSAGAPDDQSKYYPRRVNPVNGQNSRHNLYTRTDVERRPSSCNQFVRTNAAGEGLPGVRGTV